MVWALRGSAYRQDREAIAGAIEALLASSLFELQDRDLVRRALEDFRVGPGDFADYLIGWQNDAAGCERTLTFGRDLAENGRFTVLGSRPARPRA